jgi:hypothetical protein
MRPAAHEPSAAVMFTVVLIRAGANSARDSRQRLALPGGKRRADRASPTSGAESERPRRARNRRTAGPCDSRRLFRLTARRADRSSSPRDSFSVRTAVYSSRAFSAWGIPARMAHSSRYRTPPDQVLPRDPRGVRGSAPGCSLRAATCSCGQVFVPRHGGARYHANELGRVRTLIRRATRSAHTFWRAVARGSLPYFHDLRSLNSRRPRFLPARSDSPRSGHCTPSRCADWRQSASRCAVLCSLFEVESLGPKAGPGGGLAAPAA